VRCGWVWVSGLGNDGLGKSWLGVAWVSWRSMVRQGGLGSGKGIEARRGEVWC